MRSLQICQYWHRARVELKMISRSQTHYHTSNKLIQNINTVHKLAPCGAQCCPACLAFIWAVDVTASVCIVYVILMPESFTISYVCVCGFAGVPAVFISAWVITKAYSNDPGWVVPSDQCIRSSHLEAEINTHLNTLFRSWYKYTCGKNLFKLIYDQVLPPLRRIRFNQKVFFHRSEKLIKYTN